VLGGAIPKQDHEPRIVRSRRSDDVFANLQIHDAVEILQRPEPGAMLRARRRVDARLVFETHDVKQHQSSSPSMSSSPTSTTTLWMSMRNHSRNVFRSRAAGHVASSAVHAAS